MDTMEQNANSQAAIDALAEIGKVEIHHEFPPSSMEVYESCPYAYKNKLGWKEEENENSSRGTAMHRAVYDDGALEDLCEKDRETVLALRKEHVSGYAEYRHFFEHMVFLTDTETDEVIEFGTADFVVLSDDGETASLKDWKFGGRRVSRADSNLQLQIYAASLFHMYPSLKTIYAMIVQPACSDTTDYDSLQCEFSREIIDEVVSRVKKIQSRCKSASVDDANPCESNCRYCNKAACSAFKRWMDEKFRTLEAEEVMPVLQRDSMEVSWADKMLSAKDQILKMLDERCEVAKKIVMAAGGSDNFKVCAGRTMKKTNWAELAKDEGIPGDVIDRYTSVSVSAPYLRKVK